MEIIIGRDDGVVTVTCRGDRNRRGLRQLRYVLGDLVDGQGNLSVHLEFPEIDTMDPAMADLVGDVAARLSSRGGRLSVVTKTLRWSTSQPQGAGAR